MAKVRRVLSVVCLLVFLGLPVAAQSERESVSPFAGFLEAVWERLAAPLSPIQVIWQAVAGGSGDDPEPSPVGTVHGPWDPLG